MNRKYAIWGTVLLLFLMPVSSTNAAELLTPTDVVNLKMVTQASLSPDGNQIAYVLNVPREEGEKPGRDYNQIWVMDKSGKNTRRFTIEKESSTNPKWSPDGSQIAFLSKREGDKATQIYLIPANGGEEYPITESKTSIKKFDWSPDGKFIAYLKKDETGIQEKKDEELGKDWEVFEQHYKHTRLYIYDIGNKESTVATTQDMTVWDYTWMPDSRAIIFAATDKPFTDDSYMFKKIYSISIDAGEPELLYDPKAKLDEMSVSPDGKELAFLAGVDINDPASGTLFTLDLASKSVENISGDLKGTNRWVKWIKDNQVITLTEQGVWTNILEWDLKSKKYDAVMKEGPIIRSLSIIPKFKHFAFVASTPENPDELFIGNMKGKHNQLTDSNPWLKEIKLAEQETIEWKARDGLTIQGLLIKPLGFSSDKKYPLILQIHGGPEHAYLNGWNTSYGRWSQLLAQRGYMVLMPNYRGSTGRGVEYATADHHDLAGGEFNDVLDGIKYLVEEKGWVDPARVGIGGGSYGGYFSAWAVTRHSQHFAAAVVFAGITNWISFTGTTDIPYENMLVHWAMNWTESEENEKKFWDRSPMAYIRNAQTPTLIAHGEKDLRVPVSQSYELYRGLEMRDVPVELVTYPREPHGLREREHQLDYMNRALDWFNKYVKGETKMEGESPVSR